MFNEIKKIAQIYNTLTLISTKGQDTIYMSKCLEALKEVYNKMNNMEEEENIKIESEE